MPTTAWPAYRGPIARLPRTRADVLAIFGDPGRGAKPNLAWVKANIITVRDLPGVPPKWYFQVHRLAEPYLREGLRRAQLAAPGYHIARAGCFVFRHQRDDPARDLSSHSWGCNVDIDAKLNGARTFKAPNRKPVPWSAAWMKIWPKGLPRAFVEAMESVGLTWGGRWRGDYVDPQHFGVAPF